MRFQFIVLSGVVDDVWCACRYDGCRAAVTDDTTLGYCPPHMTELYNDNLIKIPTAADIEEYRLSLATTAKGATGQFSNQSSTGSRILRSSHGSHEPSVNRRRHILNSNSNPVISQSFSSAERTHRSHLVSGRNARRSDARQTGETVPHTSRQSSTSEFSSKSRFVEYSHSLHSLKVIFAT